MVYLCEELRMIKQEFNRTAMLFGDDAIELLSRKRVAVFGLGGVGGYVVEALARSGIGALDLIDHDVVSISNRNRQIIALEDTVGKKKTEVVKERVKKINPDCKVTCYDCFYLPETAEQFPFHLFDYVVDAVDTVTAKLDLIVRAEQGSIPIISCMGTGNKMDPSKLQIADIYKTTICPLARVMRRELKARGIKKCNVVYSTETPLCPIMMEEPDPGRRSTPGSTAFVPASAGLLMASKVVRDFVGCWEKGVESK